MSECFDLVYHGGGGFSWSEVWNMPIPHRKFNLRKIQEYLDRLETMRNQQSQEINEKTDLSKFKIPQEVLQASKDMQTKEKAYVTKARSSNKTKK